MRKIRYGQVCLLVLTLSGLLAAGEEYQPPESHILTMEFQVAAGVDTRIELTRADSTLVYTLFHNRLERACAVVFIHPGRYWEKGTGPDSAGIVLPMPVLESGVYRMCYCSPDTSYAVKFLYLQ